MSIPDINNPATLVDEDGLPLTPFAIDELRHARTREINELRERNRLFRSNRKKGFKEPRAGSSLFVQLDGAITKRTRGADPRYPTLGGIRFERNKRVEVRVVSEDEFVETKTRAPDAAVVTEYGAERILEDDALHVFEAPETDADVDQLVRERDAARSDADSLREQNAELSKALAAMKARRGAVDSPEGKPTRLQAGQQARAVAGQASAPAPADGSDFGGKGEPEKK